jgi:hypothetical protein
MPRTFAGLVRGAVLISTLIACKTPAGSVRDTAPLDVATAPPPLPAPQLAPSASVGYPVDMDPPKDLHHESLLRTLHREAAAVVVCELQGLRDVYGDKGAPDIFYDATCNVSEVLKGKVPTGSLHFIWQVDRDARMPPPGSEMLACLKALREPVPEAPGLKWIALDTGVFRYTEATKSDVRNEFPKR